ncbi:MAG: VOC family protein [Liquorilactobacillus hordei]|uniref:VOC family protein n=1 Tax=Liquorilactobacillus hordei TaxID=468911 RepID=UPI0039E7CD60
MQKFGEILGINHLGITVPSIKQATNFFKEAFGAKVAYLGIEKEDEPRKGAKVEHQLGLSQGAKIIGQEMIVIGNGPGIELFEIESTNQQKPLGLEDLGINHFSIFVSDIEKALKNAVAAGAVALSSVHENSKYEDTPQNGSVYVKTPWGMLIEIQTIPNGYYYPDYSETKVWVPKESTN